MKRTLCALLAAALLLLCLPVSLSAQDRSTAYTWSNLPMDWIIPVKTDGVVTGFYVIVPRGQTADFHLDGGIFESVRLKQGAGYGEPVAIPEGAWHAVRGAHAMLLRTRSLKTAPQPHDPGSVADRLRERYQGGQYGDEVFLISKYCPEAPDWDPSWDLLLYRKDGRAVLEFWWEESWYSPRGGAHAERELSDGEWDAFLAYIREHRVDFLPNQFVDEIEGGNDYVYLHYTPDAEYGFAMYEPARFTEHRLFVGMLVELVDRDGTLSEIIESGS